MTKLQRICLTIIILNLALLLAACDATWIQQANNIIAVLLPMISSILLLVGSFVGIPPSVLSAVQAWGAAAKDVLNNVVKPALDAYNGADAAGKAEILVRIKAALDTVLTNLKTVFADVHIENPNLQAKITGIFGLVITTFESLINFIPVLQAKVAGHDVDTEEAHALAHAIKPAKVLRADYNSMVEEFGKQYTI